MARPVSVLVVASVTADSPQLVEALLARQEAQGELRVTLVLPCSGPGLGSKEAASKRLAEVLQTWRDNGLGDVDGVVGDQQPTVAALEVWDPLAHDEIIVSTLSGQASNWLRWDVPHRIAQATDAHVTHVEARPQQEAPRAEPAARKAPSPLGPLSVGSWGQPKDDAAKERERRLRALGKR
jgi:hypothetical protein